MNTASFRNTDPPHLVTVWNEALPNRGAFTLRSAAPLDRWVFSKPYFDPAGLIVACEDGIPVGFGHAGFGPNNDQTALDYSTGVVAMIAVRLAQRRQHIGSELLRRAEDYLIQHGAKELYAGGMKPVNPFYFGLYGGSNSPGFLESDPAMRAFFEARGYQQRQRCLVIHRKLDQPLNVVDTRFSSLRRRFDVQVLPRSRIGTWWQECMLGQLEQFEYRLDEKSNGQAGRPRSLLGNGRLRLALEHSLGRHHGHPGPGRPAPARRRQVPDRSASSLSAGTVFRHRRGASRATRATPPSRCSAPWAFSKSMRAICTVKVKRQKVKDKKDSLHFCLLPFTFLTASPK